MRRACLLIAYRNVDGLYVFLYKFGYLCLWLIVIQLLNCAVKHAYGWRFGVRMCCVRNCWSVRERAHSERSGNAAWRGQQQQQQQQQRHLRPTTGQRRQQHQQQQRQQQHQHQHQQQQQHTLPRWAHIARAPCHPAIARTPVTRWRERQTKQKRPETPQRRVEPRAHPTNKSGQ